MIMASCRLAPYPESLSRRGLAGFVIVRFVVEASGNIDPESVRPESPVNPELDAWAVTMARSCTFAPARVGGTPQPARAWLRIGAELRPHGGGLDIAASVGSDVEGWQPH
jgi:TonB family protein